MSEPITHFGIWSAGSNGTDPVELGIRPIRYPDPVTVEEFGLDEKSWGTHLTGDTTWDLSSGRGDFHWDTSNPRSDVVTTQISNTQSPGPYQFGYDMDSELLGEINVGWYSSNHPSWGDWNSDVSEGRTDAGISFNLHHPSTGTIWVETNRSEIDTGVETGGLHFCTIDALDFSTSPQTGTYRIEGEGGVLSSGAFEFEWEYPNGTWSAEDWFCDTWSDGSYDTPPTWEVYLSEGDYNAEIRTMDDVPIGGTEVLTIAESNGGGTEGIIGWENGLQGWQDDWTLEGAFYTTDLNNSIDYQKQELFAYYDGKGGSAPIEVTLGFTDSSGNQLDFQINGGLINSVDTSESVFWGEHTWYQYEIAHHGDGLYTGRLWRGPDFEEVIATAVSRGRTPGIDDRVAALTINGAGELFVSDDDLAVDHSYMKWGRGSPVDFDPNGQVQAATATTVQFVPGLDENDEAGGDDNHSVFPNGYYGPAFTGFYVDPTRVGDKLREPYSDLSSFMEADKQVQPFDGEYRRYRVKNSIAVGFHSKDGKTIDEDEISVLVNVETPDDDVIHDHGQEDDFSFTVRNFSKEVPERMPFSILEEDWPERRAETLANRMEWLADPGGLGVYRETIYLRAQQIYENSDLPFLSEPYPRFASARTVTYDSPTGEVEGVQVSTIFGGIEPYIEHHTSGILEEIGRTVLNAPPVPIVYTWIEMTVYADGTKIFRVPDATIMPKLGAYFQEHDEWNLDNDMREYANTGEYVGENGLEGIFEPDVEADPDKYEIAIEEDRNEVFRQWYNGGGKSSTPYHAAWGSRMRYLTKFADDPGRFGSHPIISYGISEDGEELSDEEICNIISSTSGAIGLLSPFELSYQEILDQYGDLPIEPGLPNFC